MSLEANSSRVVFFCLFCLTSRFCFNLKGFNDHLDYFTTQWCSIALQVAALLPDIACSIFICKKKIKLVKMTQLSSGINCHKLS